MLIRRLESSDAAAYRTLRLDALREFPSAFSSSYEEECDTPLAIIAERLARGSGRDLFGAFHGDELVGMVVVARESGIKLRHKACIRGMVVSAACQGKGVGRQLLERALACVATMDGVRKVTLSVTGGNAPAIALYTSAGFEPFGCEQGATLVDGVLYDELLMALDTSAR